MLTFEGVKISLGEFELCANFSVDQGAKVAVIGPSGSGKSTLLGAIAGFVEPAQGEISWLGQNLSNLVPGKRPVSMVFQDNNLFPHLTAYQNVALGVNPSMRLSGGEKEQVFEALESVGLKGFADRKPAALSGGQQSRVALARMLVRARPVVLLDEPFAALGPALREEMLDLVGNLVEKSGATLLMVTHDPKDAERIADQTILVVDGVAQAPVGTAALLANPPKSLRDYLG